MKETLLHWLAILTIMGTRKNFSSGILLRRYLKRANAKVISPLNEFGGLSLEINNSQLKLRHYRTSDYEVFFQIFGDREYASLCQFLKLKYSDDFAFIFIDCGANIGLASAYIQTQFAKAKFVGIEPSFDNIEMAQLNVKYEKLFHRALTSKNKQLVDLFSPVGDPGQWAFRVHNDETGNIETMDLAALLEELKPWDQLPFILKVDIEGSEFEVFRNAPATIVQQFDIIIVEIHDFIDEPSSLIHLICSHGYSTFPMGEYWFFKRI